MLNACAASAKEIEKLKAELEKAKQEATVEKAAAQEAATALSALRATSDKHEARVEEKVRGPGAEGQGAGRRTIHP